MIFHETMMLLALEEARLAYSEGETPVGAVVTCGETVVAKAHNLREQSGDPTAHAEVLAIRQAAEKLGKRRLNDCTLYVTLEPCPMCAGAIVMACVGQCYFGAKDLRQGCAESLFSLTMEPSFYHRTPCTGGLLEKPCAALLDEFFSHKRNNQ